MSTRDPTGDSLWDPLPDVDPVAPGEVPALLDDLEATGAGFLDEHAEKFDPFEWDTVQERFLRRKAFGEAGLMLLQANEIGVDAATPNLADQVVELTNERRYRHHVQRQPVMVRMWGYPIQYVERSGRMEDPALSAALTESLEDVTVWGEERVPFEYLDLCHLAAIQGVEAPLDPGTLLDVSCLNQPVSVFRSDYEDLNTLTHDVMIAGSFGMGIEGFETPPREYDASLMLKLGLFRALADPNYDSGLEYLFCGVMQHQVPVDLARIWLGHVVDVADHYGFVPKDLAMADDPRSTEEQAVERASSEDPLIEQMGHLDDETLGWLVHYHVNLVACLATRGIREYWDGFEAEATSAGFEEGAYEAAEMQKLGQVVLSLCDYDLKQAARRITELAGTPITRAYPEVFDACVEFLRDQRRDDGHFGFWPDEETKFVAMGYDAETFERKMVGPTSEVCREALEAVEAAER